MPATSNSFVVVRGRCVPHEPEDRHQARGRFAGLAGHPRQEEWCNSAETWFPNRALMWEPQPDMFRLLALELVAASDPARKFLTTKSIPF